jgi:translation initiation factor 2 beta subunit (eIF-2beta)/eIF-5
VAGKKKALRPDTTLASVGEPEKEVYVRELPVCCICSFKEAILEADDRRLLELRCSCGRSWHVTSSLDSRVLARFVTHGGTRAGGTYPAA